jgi:hypothetical protein
MPDASVIAEKAIGANAHAASVRLGIVQGSLVYTALVAEINSNFHSVLVDPGNGKVLAFSQIPQQDLLMDGGMGMGMFGGIGSGMGVKAHVIGPHGLGIGAGIKHHGIVTQHHGIVTQPGMTMAH